jgi:hypothetical protein
VPLPLESNFLQPGSGFIVALAIVALVAVGAVVAIVLLAARRRPSPSHLRLRDLERAHDEGLITQAEYDARRTAIIDET